MIKQITNMILGLSISIGMTAGIMYMAFKLNEWINRENE
jgi:hypothetical protein